MQRKKLIYNINNYLNNNTILKRASQYLENITLIDFKDEIKFDINKQYNKILIYSSKYFDIYIICWTNNISSVIHNHPKNGCLMKILQGKLYEKLYDKNLKLIGNNIYKKDNISYIDDTIGYHSISSLENNTISLHIYSPPNLISSKY